VPRSRLRSEIEKIGGPAGGAAKNEAREPDMLEHEIECPRCHDNMKLCTEFDSLYYGCEECDFCLFAIKKT
jgi:hypothetical protein